MNRERKILEDLRFGQQKHKGPQLRGGAPGVPIPPLDPLVHTS